jgi:EmrB/QacA subfamily drug resistance transporter
MSLVTDTNRRWWTLGAVTFSLFMVMLDLTIVNVALPAIQKDLVIKLSQLEWVVNAYLLTYAALLLPGGKLADFLGRRLILLVGLVVFTGASLACGLATGGAMLIGARAVQGVGAALMMPATHSLISANFEEREHGLAYGIWAGVSMLGLSLGPFVGGVLVQTFSWPWIFYVNIPLGVLALIPVRLVVRESKDRSTDQGLDPAGIVFSAVALFALVFALIEGNGYGWFDRFIVGCFACAAIAFVVFLILEAYQRKPMLDLSVFRNSTFTGANVVVLLTMLTMLGVFFFASLYLQYVLHYTAIRTGATFLPMTIVLMLVSPFAGKLGDKVGFAWPVAAGMILLGVSMILFSRQGIHATFWHLLPPLIIGGIGIGTASAPATAAAMSATPLDKAGVGGGVLVTFRQTGGSLGVAIMGAIVSAELGKLVPGVRGFAHTFTVGFHHALLAAAGISFAGALIAALTIRRVREVEPVATGAERLVGTFVGTGTVAGVWLPPPSALGAPAIAPPVLIAQTGPLTGRRFHVDGDLLIGRGPANVRVDDLEVSRRHAIIRPVDGAVEIADLGSVNGTFVNGERIDGPRRLADGDVIRVGDVSLQVEVPQLRVAATVHVGLPTVAPAVLIVKEGPLTGERFPVERELSFGRENTDIVLDDAEVSRRHALARPVEGGVEILDLGSANGTFVNGERIGQPRQLSDGDVIRLGRVSFQVEVPAPLRTAPTVHAGVRGVVSPVLVVKDGPLAGERFPVEGELSLGRQDAAIVLDDPEISRRHALARPVDGTVEIVDLGSVNGTFVNGERIDQPRRLRDGDTIKLGRTSLQLEAPSPGAGATMVSSAPAEPMTTAPSVADQQRRPENPQQS